MQIAVQTMTNYHDTLRLAHWCEANGVTALAVADHYLSAIELESPAVDQLVVLGGIARETSRLELCTLVSPLTFRHPAVHLKTAVALDQMSEGRFTLGLGTGWMQAEHDAYGFELYPMPERFARLEESLAYVRAALDPSGPGFFGEHYQLAGGFTPQPLPTNLRIVVGGGGSRRTPDLAGRFADEFNVFPAESPMSDRIASSRASWSAAHRAGVLFVSTAFPPVAGADEHEVEETLGRIASRSDRSKDEVRERYRSLGIPVGTIPAIGDALSQLEEIGVERIYLQGGNDVEAMIHQAELFLEATG